MAQRRGNLVNALQESAGKPQNDVVAEPKTGQSYDRPSRRNTKLIGGHFDDAVSRQLRHMAIDEGKTVQGMVAEALNLLFEKYGKKPIA